ncbi:hypothetical protein M8C21_015020, partial [Ambrosia artemisiifolia]
MNSRRSFTGESMIQSPVFGFRPVDPAVMVRDEDFTWRRMMCSAAEPAAKAPAVKQAEEGEKKKEGGGEVASYWGISRSKITREDGTEWPWNCFMQSGGWIKALLEEAENERMHLMTMVELVKPKWYERLLVLTVQGVFFNAFFVIYILSPKLAHRIVGYLEEEAIHSYTEFLKDIESGAIENVPAPAIAIDYWRLPKDSTLKEVITVIRADEAHHRDVNHFASDIHFQGKELREAPAPV